MNAYYIPRGTLVLVHKRGDKQFSTHPHKMKQEKMLFDENVVSDPCFPGRRVNAYTLNEQLGIAECQRHDLRNKYVFATECDEYPYLVVDSDEVLTEPDAIRAVSKFDKSLEAVQ